MKLNIDGNTDWNHWGLGICGCAGHDHVRLTVQLGPFDVEVYVSWGE